MRSRDLIPFALLGSAAIFIIVQGSQMGRDRRARRATERAPQPAESPAPTPQGVPRQFHSQQVVAPPVSIGRATSGPVEVRLSGEPAPPRDDAAIRSRIADGSPGTYLPDMLKQQEQLLMRWPDRRIDALRVWIDRHPMVADFQGNYPLVVEQAFDEWRGAGFPVRFDIMPLEKGSAIQIRWIDSFPRSDSGRIGLTKKTRDQNGWMVGAEITIATHDPEGNSFPPALVAGIARHEVGHALGLGHSPNATDVMYPESRTTIISQVDRATLHLLYTLPPGVVK